MSIGPEKHEEIVETPLTGVDRSLPDLMNDPIEEISKWVELSLPAEIREQVLKDLLKVRENKNNANDQT